MPDRMRDGSYLFVDRDFFRSQTNRSIEWQHPYFAFARGCSGQVGTVPKSHDTHTHVCARVGNSRRAHATHTELATTPRKSIFAPTSTLNPPAHASDRKIGHIGQLWPPTIAARHPPRTPSTRVARAGVCLLENQAHVVREEACTRPGRDPSGAWGSDGGETGKGEANGGGQRRATARSKRARAEHAPARLFASRAAAASQKKAYSQPESHAHARGECE